MLHLAEVPPFARGGNRLCFVHPEYKDRCVKVRRPDFSLEKMRQKKGFPNTLKPLSWLDESLKEHAAMTRLHSRLGDPVYAIVARDYGFIETDMGSGLCSELIRNADGKISRSVMQYVWENGFTPELASALEKFQGHWQSLLIPTRSLLLHNVVVQCDASGQIKRLVIIDGVGASGVIPFDWFPRAYKVHRAIRKFEDFKKLIVELAEVRKSGVMPSSFWLLKHDGVSAANENPSTSSGTSVANEQLSEAGHKSQSR